MKEIVGEETGKKYVVRFSHGVLAQLQGLIFESVPDATMDRIGRELKARGKGLEDFHEEIMTLGGDVLKGMMKATGGHNSHMLAEILVSVDGTFVGETLEERLEYVYGGNHPLGCLDPFDGQQIIEELQPILTRFQEGRAKKGESRPTSKDNNGQKRKAIPVQVLSQEN